MLTTEDVAMRLGIGRNETLKALRAGRIPSLRLGRRWLVPRKAFERMLSGDPETPAAA
jgi:excisionase family DNA binding protein